MYPWKIPSPKHLCKDPLESSSKGRGSLHPVYPLVRARAPFASPMFVCLGSPAPVSVSVSSCRLGTPCFSGNVGGMSALEWRYGGLSSCRGEMCWNTPEGLRQDGGVGVRFRTPLRQDHSWPEGRRGQRCQALMGVRSAFLGRQGWQAARMRRVKAGK